MATSTLAPTGKQYFWNTVTGEPLAGGLVYTYLAGTSTPQTTYTDSAGLVPNSNPIVLNSAGYAVIYFGSGQSYKFVVTDAAGVTQWTQDNMSATPIVAPAVDITGTAGVTIAANQVAYLSDGSNSLTAGRWYLADSGKTSSSLTPIIGVALAGIAAGSVGSFRLGGQLGGFSGLVAGAVYYVSTAGTVTLTPPPTLARIVGQADTTTELILACDPPNLNPALAVGLCEGRLTLTAGTPVTQLDVTGAATIYFTPYTGNRVALYDIGTGLWTVWPFTEISLPLGTLTSGKPYDVFLVQTAGVLTLAIAAWTSDTTRAAVLTTQDGVIVNTLLGTRYLGTFYTTSATTTEDSALKRYCWNYYNRARRRLFLPANNAVPWNYTTATVRQAGGLATNQVEVVIGVAEIAITLSLNVTASNTNAGVAIQAGIAIISTTVMDTTNFQGGSATTPGAAYLMNLVVTGTVLPSVGRYPFTWLEWSAATGTTTWNTNNGTLTVGNGLSGWIEG